MNKFVFIFSCIFLLSLFSVSANLIITPHSNSLEVFRGVSKDFQLTVWNNNSFNIYGVTFSNTTNFLFPEIFNMTANETKTITYRVTTQELFTSSFVATTSFSFLVPFTPVPNNFSINVSNTNFLPSELSIVRNDSVVWRNLLSDDVVVRDFQGSGFVDVSIPALSSVRRTYTSLGDFAFYNSVLGYSGVLHVGERSNVTFAHNSVDDVTTIFSVKSVLPDNTLSISLVGSLSADNNQSVQGFLTVANNDESIVLTNIHLSADRWVSNFSDNDFILEPSTAHTVSSKLISFNVTPFISRTADSNRSNNITITVTSSNAGTIIAKFPIFINYINLNTTTVNGINYTLNILGIPETISACIQHFGERGYESCKDLKDWARENVTVVVEVPAQYKFSEQDILDFKAQLKTFGDSSLRTENKNNLYFAKQDNLNVLILNNSVQIKDTNDKVNSFMIHYDDTLRRQNIRYWTTVVFTSLIVLLALLSWFISGVLYYNALVESFQA